MARFVIQPHTRIQEWIALALVMVTLACESPTRPDSRIPPPVGTPTSMQLQPCEYADQAARCDLQARWGDLYSSTRMVTREALWASSAPAVVRVSAPGSLQAIAPGDADVHVSFDGAELRAQFRVLAEGPPWRVLTGGEHHIRVLDQNGDRLDGVLVEIIAGGNAGLQAVSDRSGSAIFRADIVCGPITVRGTKPAYREWVGSATLCGRAGNGRWGSETVGPVRMLPADSPPEP